MGGMGGPPPPPVTGVTEDVPFVQCAVCKQLVKRSYFMAKSLRNTLKSTKVSEDRILEMLAGDPGYNLPNAPATASGGVCNADSKEGEWLHWFDMQEDASARTIALKKMNVPGVCDVECKTIALACAEALAIIDSPLAAALYLNTSSAKEVEREACGALGVEGWASSLAGSCSKAAPLTPEHRKEGGIFAPKPKEEELPPAGTAAPTTKKKRKAKKKAKKKAADKAEL